MSEGGQEPAGRRSERRVAGLPIRQEDGAADLPPLDEVTLCECGEVVDDDGECPIKKQEDS